MLTATYLVYKCKMRYHRVLYGVFKIYTVWILLKTLGCKVLELFVYHRWHHDEQEEQQWIHYETESVHVHQQLLQKVLTVVQRKLPSLASLSMAWPDIAEVVTCADLLYIGVPCIVQFYI